MQDKEELDKKDCPIKLARAILDLAMHSNKIAYETMVGNLESVEKLLQEAEASNKT